MMSFVRRMGLVTTVVVALVAAVNTWAAPAPNTLTEADSVVEQVIFSPGLRP